MKIRLSPVFAVVAATLPAMADTSAPPPPPDPTAAVGFLRPGERLVFKLGWGLVSNAGQTTIETLPAEDGDKFVRVRVLTESRGLVRTLYPLENDSVAHLDPRTGRTDRIVITGRDGKRATDTITRFDYEAGLLTHTDSVRTHRSGSIALPTDEPVYDLMVTMLRLRESPPAPGETRNVKVTFEDDIYDIELRALEADRIRTPAGAFDAVVIEPRQLGEPRGFFKKGGQMKFWLSTGPEPQLVRMDFRVKVGTISSVLTAIETIDPSGDAADPRP